MFPASAAAQIVDLVARGSALREARVLKVLSGQAVPVAGEAADRLDENLDAVAVRIEEGAARA